MRQKFPLVLGLLGLVLGLALLTQSVGRLRAEPAGEFFGVCPCVDESEATTDCAVSYECQNDVDCSEEDHWEVETSWPKECLSVKPQKRLCNSENAICKHFLNCVFNGVFCQRDVDNPHTGDTANALKLVGGDCSASSRCPQ